MKKLLAGLLLSGLFLSTTSTVYAAEGQSTQTTPVSSAIEATYVITIPSALSIDITGTSSDNATGVVTLEDLTAAGSVSINATATDLALTTGTGLSNETLTTTLAFGNAEPTKTSDISLTNVAATESITVNTAESGQDNLSGAYTGSINFIFDYVPAVAE